MALDPSAIASAVQKEIERQQAAVVYDDLSADELEKVVAQLTEKLSMCKEALAKRGGDGAAAPVAARKAEKSTGKFPDLPWGVAGKQDAQKIHDYISENMQKRIMVIDGAMGTTIQQYKFTEEDFRGAPRDVHVDLSRARWHARPAYTQWLAQPIPLTGRRQIQGRAGDPGAEGQQRSASLHAA